MTGLRQRIRRAWAAKRAHATEQPIELRLPSRLGYEKVAMDTVALVAERMGFSAERIDGLRTAISEAVTNAIEHGNRNQPRAEVLVTIQADQAALIITVRDQSTQPFDRSYGTQQPDLHRALSGEEVGWGMWLIRQFVDDVQWNSSASGNEVCMVLYR